MERQFSLAHRIPSASSRSFAAAACARASPSARAHASASGTSARSSARRSLVEPSARSSLDALQAADRPAPTRPCLDRSREVVTCLCRLREKSETAAQATRSTDCGRARRPSSVSSSAVTSVGAVAEHEHLDERPPNRVARLGAEPLRRERVDEVAPRSASCRRAARPRASPPPTRRRPAEQARRAPRAAAPSGTARPRRATAPSGRAPRRARGPRRRAAAARAGRRRASPRSVSSRVASPRGCGRRDREQRRDAQRAEVEPLEDDRARPRSRRRWRGGAR